MDKSFCFESFNPWDLYRGKPLPNYGEAEVFIGEINSCQVISRMSLFLNNYIHKKYEREAIKDFVVCLPPKSDVDFERSKLVSDLIEFTDGKIPESRILDFFKSKFKFEVLPSMECQFLLDLLNSVNPFSILFIPNGNLINNSDEIGFDVVSKFSSKLSEDVWVDSFVEMSNYIISEAKKRDLFVVLICENEQLFSKRNKEKISDVESLYPVYFFHGVEPVVDFDIEEKLKVWSFMCFNGEVDKALDEIDSIQLEGLNKVSLKIQLLGKASRYKQACQLIRKEQGSEDFNIFKIKFAHIANRAADHELVKELLENHVSEIEKKQDLELALIFATDASSISIAQEAFEKLSSLYSGSDVLRENIYLRLFNIINNRTDEYDSSWMFGFNELERSLALNKDRIELKELNSKDEYELVCITNSMKESISGNHILSIVDAGCIDEGSIFEPHSIKITLSSISKEILNTSSFVKSEIFEQSLTRLVSYVANHPKDTSIRLGLAEVLSVGSLGSSGLPVMVYLTIKSIKLGLDVDKEECKTVKISDDEFIHDIENIMNWMGSQSVVEVGVTKLPQELLPINIEPVIDKLKGILTLAVSDSYESESMVVEQFAYCICLLSPYSVDYNNEDLFAIKTLANYFWSIGKPQKSRDLAEQVLELSGSSILRKRIAWGIYSDIYLRLSNPLEALIASTCSFSLDAQVDKYQAFSEIYLLAKITRDLHLYDLCKEVIVNGMDFIERYSLSKQAYLRMKTLDACICQITLNDNDREGSIELINVLAELAKNVKEEGDELTPSLVLLMQAIENHKFRHGDINCEITQSLAPLISYLPHKTRGKLELLSSRNPRPLDILNFYDKIEGSRYGEDRPEDLKYVKLLAKRCLDIEPQDTPDPIEHFHLLELICDSSTFSDEDNSSLGRENLIKFVKELTASEFSVLYIGLTSEGRLTHLLIQDSKLLYLNFEEISEDLSENILRWQDRYPHNYGYIESQDGNNEFYDSMSRFKLPFFEGKRVIVCAEPKVQQLPVNLFLYENGFLGEVKPTCYVPSLSWLRTSNQNDPPKYKRTAWISTSNSFTDVLTRTLGRLEGVFSKYGFDISTQDIDAEFCSNSEITVLTAHGGLIEKNEYFHKVSDEQGFKACPRTIASKVRNCEVVILFVCSGGRLDKNPYSDTSFGLSKMLLDSGCKTVIASSWPLNSQIVDIWLNSFMGEWVSGKCSTDACLAANLSVASRFSYFAGEALAMFVYGDPRTKICY